MDSIIIADFRLPIAHLAAACLLVAEILERYAKCSELNNFDCLLQIGNWQSEIGNASVAVAFSLRDAFLFFAAMLFERDVFLKLLSQVLKFLGGRVFEFL